MLSVHLWTHVVRFDFKRNNIWFMYNRPMRRPTWSFHTCCHCLLEIWMISEDLSEAVIQKSKSSCGFTFQFDLFLLCDGCFLGSNGAVEAVSTLGTLGPSEVTTWVGEDRWRCRFLWRLWRARPSLWRLVVNMRIPRSECLLQGEGTTWSVCPTFFHKQVL